MIENKNITTVCMLETEKKESKKELRNRYLPVSEKDPNEGRILEGFDILTESPIS